jgi:CrcB protein
MNSLAKPSAVIVGGGLGSYLRYVVQGWVQSKTGASFPYGTLTVNLTGAFVIGLLMTIFFERFEVGPEWRLFLTVGVLGGYTTFSSATWEAYQLFALGSQLHGVLYVLGSVLGGAVGVLIGVWVGRLI